MALTLLLQRHMTKLAIEDLAHVHGGGVWDVVDNAVDWATTKAGYPGWKEKSCPSRQQWVGHVMGSALGSAVAGTLYIGKWAPMVAGPIAGTAATYANSAYIDNCERQKARGR
jgi:hypothetical protein